MLSVTQFLRHGSAAFFSSLVHVRPVPRAGGGTDESQGRDFSWLQTYEKPLIALQSLMFWERPNHTILFLLSFHCSYWLLIWSGRMTSFVFTMAFVLSFLTIWKTRIWPEIRVPLTEDQLEREDWICLHPRALTIPELVHVSSRLLSRMHSAIHSLLLMRTESPGRFCVLVTLTLSVTACIGHMISGALVMYTILIAFFLSPALLSLPSVCSLFVDHPDSLIATEETVPNADLFDAFSRQRDEQSCYSLDRELGIVSSDPDREGSSGSSSKSSIRIVSSHFSGRQSSASDAEDRTESDDSADGSPLEEPFEMISVAELRSHSPQQD